MNPHRDRVLREQPADAGQNVAPDDDPFNPEPLTEIVLPDDGDIGRTVRESAGLTHRNVRGQFTREHDDDTISDSGPPVLDAPPAPVAPGPAVDDAPESGGLGEPPPRYAINEDGSVTLAGSNKTYANTQAALDALWHAQAAISRGEHKQPEQQIPDAPIDDDPLPPLYTTGAPIGGEPASTDELIAWAEENPAAAGRWTLANQARVTNDMLVRQIYQHWGAQDGADRDSYLAEVNARSQQQTASEMEQRIMDRLEPYLEAQQQQEITHWDQQLESLPYFAHYKDRIAVELQADASFLDEYVAMAPAEKFSVCKAIYSELRVDDSINAQNGVAAPAAAPGAAVAAVQQQAQPAQVPPIVEGRGGAAPAVDPNDSTEMVRRAVRAYQQAGDLFSPNAPAS